MEKNLSRYLVEIIVIVFSILLAFLLDRWYESYLTNKYLEKLLLDVRKEVMYDFNASTPRLQRNMEYFTEINEVLNGTNDSQEFRTLAIFGISLQKLTRDSYDEWKRYSKDLPEEFDHLGLLLAELKNRYPRRLEARYDEVVELRNVYQQYVGHEDWYRTLRNKGILTERGSTFLQEDNYARMLVEQYRVLLYTASADFVYLRGLSLRVLFETNRIIEDSTSLSTFLPKNHKPFSENFMKNITGTYGSASRPEHKYELSFSNGYLTENNLEDVDVLHSVNDSTFVSLVGQMTMTFKFLNDTVTGYTANYAPFGGTVKFSKLRDSSPIISSSEDME